MESLERDVLLLQQEVRRNREWMDYHTAELRSIAAEHSRELAALKGRPTSDHLPIYGALLKILLAMIVPLVVLFLTGDLKQALAASKLIATGG